MFTFQGCAFCIRAKTLLAQRGLPFEEVELDVNRPDLREELERLTGGMTFPQIVIDGEAIGGYSELVALVRAGDPRVG